MLKIRPRHRRKKGKHRWCPICGKVGILCGKWGSSVYYPQGHSFFVDNPSGERGYATGQRYRGLTTDFDKNTCYRVYYKRQKQWCISHYEHGSGKRTYHSLRKGIHYDLHCSYKIVKGRVIFSETPRLKKPAFKIYQKKKDFRFNDRISEKILEIKHNGAGFVQVGKGKRVLVYLFSY